MSTLQYNPAVLESEPTYVAELLHQFQITLESCIPCVITEYDANNNTVDVQPIPQRVVDTDSGIVYKDRPIIPSVPVLRMLHGGFSINFPLFKGDTGYVIAVDRNCTSAQKENSTTLFKDDDKQENNKGAMPPDDLSLAQYTNGFFLPCSWSKEGNPKGELAIEGIGKEPNDDKWQKIRLSNDGIITIETKDKQIVIGKDGINLSSGEVKLSVLDDKIVTDVGDSSITQQGNQVSVKILDKTLTIDESGIKYNGKVDTTVPCLTGIRRDVNGDIEIKTQPVDLSGNIIVKVSPETGWVKI